MRYTYEAARTLVVQRPPRTKLSEDPEEPDGLAALVWRSSLLSLTTSTVAYDAMHRLEPVWRSVLIQALTWSSSFELSP